MWCVLQVRGNQELMIQEQLNNAGSVSYTHLETGKKDLTHETVKKLYAVIGMEFHTVEDNVNIAVMVWNLFTAIVESEPMADIYKKLYQQKSSVQFQGEYIIWLLGVDVYKRQLLDLVVQ